MTQISLDLPDDIVEKLQELTGPRGSNKQQLFESVLRRSLLDLEDALAAERIADDIDSGRTSMVSLEDVMREYGLD